MKQEYTRRRMNEVNDYRNMQKTLAIRMNNCMDV